MHLQQSEGKTCGISVLALVETTIRTILYYGASET